MSDKIRKIILIVLAAFLAIVGGYMWYISSAIDEKVNVVVPDSIVE